MIDSRRTLCFFTAALLLLCGCSPSLRSNPAITVPPVATAAYTETPASDIPLIDADGNEFSLFDHLGTSILLQFWPNPELLSDAELDVMQRAYTEYGKETVFLLILSQASVSTDAFSERGMQALLCYDPTGTAAAAYGALDQPATIFIDADGFIATQSNGILSEDALFFGLSLL